MNKDDVAGHEFHGNQYTNSVGSWKGDKASESATVASLKASDVGRKAKTSDSFKEAARLHTKAAEAHAKAAVALKNEGKHGRAKEHERLMRNEQELATLHSEKAKKDDSPLDLIKTIHSQGPQLQTNDGTQLVKGDVAGHEFHGNQYTGGGGKGETKSRTTSATDTNGKSAGFRGIMVTTGNSGKPVSAKYKGKEYFSTGKSGESLGRHSTSAPKGEIMHEMKHTGPDGNKDERIWITGNGSHTHED